MAGTGVLCGDLLMNIAATCNTRCVGYMVDLLGLLFFSTVNPFLGVMGFGDNYDSIGGCCSPPR